MSDILSDDDPAMRRYRRLVRALGGRTPLAREAAALARLCAWTSQEDANILIRMIDERCRRCFDTGHDAALAELEDEHKKGGEKA
jgi:hypothetical protein